MSLNPNAKPFSFNPSAATFNPNKAATPAKPAPESTPAPAPAKESVEKVDSWEDEAEEPKTETKKEEPVAKEPVTSSPEPAKPEPVPAKTAEPEVQEEQPRARAATTSKKKSSKKSSNKPEMKAHDNREHLNVVFIGHVDAGKSTISGQILLQTGQVDERTIAKYEKEAKEKNRDSWYLAFILDTNEEERAKGKTVEVGRAHFATDKKRYTLLDAPGHKNYVPNMIGGAAQADIGVLIISARKGEFETGFDRGGQTREHALLAKTLGVTRLIVAINKMDEQTVKWSKQRYDNIVKKLTPFLKKSGFKSTDLRFIPISGYTGANIKDAVSKDVCPWLENPRSLIQTMDDFPTIKRDEANSVRIPIVTRYKDMGSLFVLGKVECGVVKRGDTLVIMPVNKQVEVLGVEVEDTETDIAKPGENVHVKIKGIDEEEVLGGFVLGGLVDPPRVTMEMECQLVVLDLLEHKPLLTSGYQCILHIHSLIVECQITALVAEIDRKTGNKKPKPKFVKSDGIAIVRVSVEQSIAVERFDVVPQLGRFTLRDEGRTIAIGKVLKMRKMKADESKSN